LRTGKGKSRVSGNQTVAALLRKKAEWVRYEVEAEENRIMAKFEVIGVYRNRKSQNLAAGW